MGLRTITMIMIITIIIPVFMFLHQLFNMFQFPTRILRFTMAMDPQAVIMTSWTDMVPHMMISSMTMLMMIIKRYQSLLPSPKMNVVGAGLDGSSVYFESKVKDKMMLLE